MWSAGASAPFDGRMKVYADAMPRFTLQLALDFGFVCWVLLWIWVGLAVHDAVEVLAEPGERINASATDLSDSMADAGDYLDGIPAVGDGVASPFESASEASTAIADAGDSEVRAVERLAFWAGVLVAGLPILYLAPKYLPGRIRWIRNASGGQRILHGDADLDVFALRAITSQPLHRLARVSDDPVGALRRGDHDTITRLARLELDRLGLRVAEPTSDEAGGPTSGGGEAQGLTAAAR